MFQHTHEEIIIGPVAPRTGKWHELAEAIREGCRMRPVQCFGELIDGPYSACAIGAALSALGSFEQIIDQPRGEDIVCPACATPSPEFGLTPIAHLNDDHEWKRERIADWLDTL